MVKGFTSFEKEIRKLIHPIVKNPLLHVRWMNTLSYLENCGARMIAACEQPTRVKEEMLKHAAEEFRHAHHLKRQIKRLTTTPIHDYSLHSLLGGVSSLHYLSSLDLKVSRYLKTIGLTKRAVKEAAYLLVTYAIELRAGELYPIYDEVLCQANSRVAVKSILLEEKEHLNEMKQGLSELHNGFIYAEQICKIESDACRQWLHAIAKEFGLDFQD